MKFINLRRPGSKPVFVVLPTENRKYTFYINSVKVRGWAGLGLGLISVSLLRSI